MVPYTNVPTTERLLASVALQRLRPKSRARAHFLFTAGFAALALTACGSGGSGDSPVSPGPPLSDNDDSSADLPGSGNDGAVDPPVVDVPDPGAVDPPGDLDSGATEPLPPMTGGVQLPPVFTDGAPLFGSGLTLDSFPLGQIVSGGVPKDGIPALSNPTFVGAYSVDYLREDDLVLGVVINGEARAYPHNIGWWHEIVNDVVGGTPICVTLCPLTGTGLVFDTADENGNPFGLGVSGLLLNNNLIMYDRRDGNTLYPQIFSTAVEGPRQGQTLTLLPVVETNWSTWVRLHPDTRVIAGGTYSTDRYTFYPYGDYRIDNFFLLFGLNPRQSANPNSFATAYGAKDMVLGVRLAGEARAYPFINMGQQAVINDDLGDVDIVVV